MLFVLKILKNMVFFRCKIYFFQKKYFCQKWLRFDIDYAMMKAII